MRNAPKVRTDEPHFDPDVDRYPNFVQGMRRILQEAEIPDEPIDRLEVNFVPSGECTYRYWLARSEESDGGVLGPA